ncbi:hypothetical protein [Dehalogenimonas sp. 4OHTPN]|uniref:DUF948 domain-containing protein n=1 Tax=Dehalogenimonas sp. 4OHTPN TaxID=3166643 RepID=A0AAU8GAF9_9CHLR
MGIEWYRDLVIVIGGVVAILIGIVILLLVISIYRKTNAIYERSKTVMTSLEKAADRVEDFTQTATQELIKPVIEIAALFQGLKAGLGVIFNRRK